MLFPNVTNTNTEGNHNIINPPIDDNVSFNPENNFEIINQEKNLTIDNNDVNTTGICFESIIPFQGWES